MNPNMPLDTAYVIAWRRPAPEPEKKVNICVVS